MTDYTKLKLADLKDLCTKRNLATNGIKKDLIARLQDADAANPSSPLGPAAGASTQQPAGTGAAAHLPSAEEYEINWDEDDTSAAAKGLLGEKVETRAIEKKDTDKLVKATTAGTGGKAGAKDETNGAGTGNGDKRPQRKRLTELFPDLPSISKDKDDRRKNAGQDQKSSSVAPTEPEPAASAAKASESKPAEKEDATKADFKANLPLTTVASELEKRKARLARFGEENVGAASKEAMKKLERAQRFGGVEATQAKEVRGLDSALPERRKPVGKRGYEGQAVGRGGVNKRQRYNNVGGRGPNTNQQQQRRNVSSRPVQKGSGVLDDPAEREKAEKRKQRFGN